MEEIALAAYLPQTASPLPDAQPFGSACTWPCRESGARQAVSCPGSLGRRGLRAERLARRCQRRVRCLELRLLELSLMEEASACLALPAHAQSLSVPPPFLLSDINFFLLLTFSTASSPP